jgi:hypothetical protein
MSKHRLHLLVGDTDIYLSKCALQYDSTAYLITQENASDPHVNTVYTSLGDLGGVQSFFQLLMSATEITYCPPTNWSDGKTTADRYSLAWLTEHYLGIAANLNNIKINGVLSVPIQLSVEEQRKNDATQLWVAGCSTTFGAGVAIHERYANLLSDKLNLPVSVLAYPGASVLWSASQILRSDIQKDDLVVFGVSTYYRITMFNCKKVYHMYTKNLKENSDKFPELNILQFDSDTRIYECVSAIEQVINFCNKVGAKLILVGIHANIELSLAMSNYKNFVFYHGKFGTDFQDGWYDLGTDKLHPGPETHKIYANLVMSKINELGFIN